MATVSNYQPQQENLYGFTSGIPGIKGGSSSTGSLPLYDRALLPTTTPVNSDGAPNDAQDRRGPDLTPEGYQNAAASFFDNAGKVAPSVAGAVFGPLGSVAVSTVGAAIRGEQGRPKDTFFDSLINSILGNPTYADLQAGRPKAADLFAPELDIPDVLRDLTPADKLPDPNETAPTDVFAGTDASMAGGGLAPQGANDGLGGGSVPFAAGGLVTPMPPPPMQMNALPPSSGNVGLAAPGTAPGPSNPQLVDTQINNLLAEAPPAVQKLQLILQQAVQAGETTPAQIQQLGQIARVCLQNPAMYPQLVRLAEQKGIIPPGELPPKYSERIVKLIMLAARALGGASGQSGSAPGQEFSRGGPITGPGTGTSDSIPGQNVSNGGKVKVSNGEYIIPAKVVQIKGKEFFDNLLRKYADVSGEGSAA